MLVRSHPRQAFDVSADEVHHYGLRSIIEIVAGREVSRTDIAGLLIHEHAAEHPAVGAGAAGTGTQRLGVDLAAVQILRHLGQQAVQVVADAPQLGFVGQPPLAVGDASGLGAEIQRHKLPCPPGVHGAVDTLIIQKQAVQRVGGLQVGIFAGHFLPGHALGCGVSQQVFYAGGGRGREQRIAVAFQRKQIQKHLAVQPAVDFFELELLAAGLVVHHPQVSAAVAGQRHGVHAVDGAHHADGVPCPVIQAHRLDARGVGVVAGAVIDAQLKGHRLKARLAQVPLDEPQQVNEVTADALH